MEVAWEYSSTKSPLEALLASPDKQFEAAVAQNPAQHHDDALRQQVTDVPSTHPIRLDVVPRWAMKTQPGVRKKHNDSY
jgi:hypothetical protein